MKIELVCACRWCSKETSLIVEEKDFDEWQGGVLIQVAMPYLSADERELLISGTCPTCWDSMFSSDEDEDVDDYTVAMQDSLAFTGQWW